MGGKRSAPTARPAGFSLTTMSGSLLAHMVPGRLLFYCRCRVAAPCNTLTGGEVWSRSDGIALAIFQDGIIVDIAMPMVGIEIDLDRLLGCGNHHDVAVEAYIPAGKRMAADCRLPGGLAIMFLHPAHEVVIVFPPRRGTTRSSRTERTAGWVVSRRWLIWRVSREQSTSRNILSPAIRPVSL